MLPLPSRAEKTSVRWKACEHEYKYIHKPSSVPPLHAKKPTIALKGRRTSPCSRVLASGPLTRAAQHARRCPGGQPRPRPDIRVSTAEDEPPPTPHSPAGTYHSQVLKRPGSLDVLQRLLQVGQFGVDPALRVLGTLHSLCLESLNSLDLTLHIVLLGLEGIDLLLDVVDDGGVAQDGAVVREVDFLRLVGEDLHPAARIVVALLEGREGLGGAAFDAELLRDWKGQ